MYRLQAGRGTTSHYNITTPFDGAVFSTMGVMIGVNTLLAFLVLILFFLRTVPLEAPYLWGIRLGLALFVLGSVEGFVMIVNGAHTVGAPDGGPGLPFLNWSTRAGDLRVAHLLGLHSIQILPLIGYAVSRWGKDLPRLAQVSCVLGLAVIYLAIGAALFWRAMTGQPFIRI